MSYQLELIAGQLYRIVRPFTDFDRYTHQVGETWVFEGTSFLPYEDGLTVFIKREDVPHTVAFRMQCRPEEQGDIVDHFPEYVEAI